MLTHTLKTLPGRQWYRRCSVSQGIENMLMRGELAAPLRSSVVGFLFRSEKKVENSAI